MNTDSFPLVPDYALDRGYDESGILRGGPRGGQRYTRQSGPPQRTWRAVFNNRSDADWASLEQFYRRVVDDFFIFTPPDSTRGFPVQFAGPVRENWAGNQQHNLAVDLIEAVGCAPAVYPQTPLLALPVARFVDVGTGKMIAYAGYGFSIAATGVADMLVDGVSVGAVAPVYNINLGLHRLEVQPNTAVITAFSFVA